MKIQINFILRNVKYVSLIAGLLIGRFYSPNNVGKLSILSIIFFTIAIIAYIFELYSNPEDIKNRKTNKFLNLVSYQPPKLVLLLMNIIAFSYLFYIILKPLF